MSDSFTSSTKASYDMSTRFCSQCGRKTNLENTCFLTLPGESVPMCLSVPDHIGLLMCIKCSEKVTSGLVGPFENSEIITNSNLNIDPDVELYSNSNTDDDSQQHFHPSQQFALGADSRVDQNDSMVLGKPSNSLVHNDGVKISNTVANTHNDRTSHPSIPTHSTYEPLNKLLLVLRCQNDSEETIMNAYSEFRDKVLQVQYDGKDALGAQFTRSRRIVNAIWILQANFANGTNVELSVEHADNILLNIIYRLYEALNYNVVREGQIVKISFNNIDS